MCVYIDTTQPERQEIIKDWLQELTPIVDLDKEHTVAAAKASPLNDPEVAKHLLDIYGEVNVEIAKKTNKTRR